MRPPRAGACMLVPRHKIGTLALAATILLLPVALAGGNDPNECDAIDDAPDVIVGDLHETMRFGRVGDITGYSIGTTSCNVGTCWLEWDRASNRHPVIGQNLYRLKDGRFEQVGQSWLKHGFFALSQSLCSTECVGTDGEHLGVNCSDPYDADFNGLQVRLGPKSEVNPATGEFAYPFGAQGASGDAIYKRLQVHDADIDPQLNAGAVYYGEGQYVTPDDAAAGNGLNNVSHRRLLVAGNSGVWNLFVPEEHPTVQGPAIDAWVASQSGVERDPIDVPDDGRLVAASTAADLGDGFHGYEYAVQNLTSHRAVRSFHVPLPPGVAVRAVGFHDVDYHSGEPYDGTPWVANVTPDGITFSTDAFETNENANALRWGTLYNFRFEADLPPGPATITLGLFRPGTPESVPYVSRGPAICNANGVCDGIEDGCNCPDDCGSPPVVEGVCDDGLDEDCDGLVDCVDPDCCGDLACDDGIDDDGDGFAGCDCDDGDPESWSPPGPAELLRLEEAKTGTLVRWLEPAIPGATDLRYDVIRSPRPDDFVVGGVCVVSDGLDLDFVDADVPLPGSAYYYLVRAENGCPVAGSLGKNSSGQSRQAVDCP